MRRINYDFVGDIDGIKLLDSFDDETISALVTEVQRTGNALFGDGIEKEYKLYPDPTYAETFRVEEAN